MRCNLQPTRPLLLSRPSPGVEGEEAGSRPSYGTGSASSVTKSLNINQFVMLWGPFAFPWWLPELSRDGLAW
jgi:hypothetical protein